ncbi:hypothetical protein [Chryseobacterium oranimense]|uniref:hypothetical protein n=1 Tax=Chryseobacterium oranimense TaxID=421058 RepID=UPI002235EF96|nr:hypothetical protein [Chryseobacterium oranimense]
MKFKFNLKSDAKKMAKHSDLLQDKFLKREMSKTIKGGDGELEQPLEEWSNNWSNLGWSNAWRNGINW